MLAIVLNRSISKRQALTLVLSHIFTGKFPNNTEILPYNPGTGQLVNEPIQVPVVEEVPIVPEEIVIPEISIP